MPLVANLHTRVWASTSRQSYYSATIHATAGTKRPPRIRERMDATKRWVNDLVTTVLRLCLSAHQPHPRENKDNAGNLPCPNRFTQDHSGK